MGIHRKYKLIQKRLGINDAQVAEIFGYKNPMSFANSGKGKEKIIAGVVALFEKIAETQTDFWSFDDLDE
jgi:hypothetical protein